MMIRVYVSSATDSRPIETLLARYRLSCTIEPLPMGSAEQRARFAELKSAHDWSQLPMVFVDDAFIGGEPELRRHLAEHAADPAARLAFALGIGGLIPFVALGVVLLAGLDISPLTPMTLLLGYAATILSFVGAVHWGMALAAPNRRERPMLLAGSVVPALIAWLALALPAGYDLALFIAGFAGWYAWERLRTWPLYPSWYRSLRSVLTATVCAVLLLAALVAG